MVFEKIQTIIADQLETSVDDITLEKDIIKDLEADSLDAVDITNSIEDEFDIEVPEEAAEDFHTVGDLVAYVESMLN